MSATGRQRYAFAHPLNDAILRDVSAYRHVRKHATGLLLMTILAATRRCDGLA